MKPGGERTVEGLRAELRAEARAARLTAWTLRLLAVAFAAAYLVSGTLLGHLDAFYLLLTLGTLLAGGSQFVFIERYRVPDALTRLAAHPTPELHEALAALWPAIRATHGRGLAALGPRLFSADEIAALSLDEAAAFVRDAGRRDWAAFARAWGLGLAVVLAGIVVACALHRPDSAGGA